MRKLIFMLILIAALSSQAVENPPEGSPFRKYWYQGKAELSRYELKQARYGELHSGEAVLIFVTEPFLKEKQVKYESGDRKDAISVLKTNFTRKFNTGIYPYSVMTSVFTPVSDPAQHALKVSTSVQEWCGHTYSQMNFRENGYQVKTHSYFQDESDQEFKLPIVWLEDEIWSRIRIAPDSLPVGDMDMIPGLHFARFQHKPSRPEKVKAKVETKGNRKIYSLEYPGLNRRVQIEFEKDFPYSILAWQETAPGGFGPGSPLLTTTGTRTNTLMLDYWNKHGNEDSGYRKQLGLKN